MIRLSDISKAYGPQRVFENFSLEIEDGKILCVLGESGGGKTTLLNILAGLVPFSGNLSGVPKRVSYIFQEPRLLPNMTVKQNLAYAGGASEKIDDILEKTELIKCANKRPGELSGGEKQRVSIARAFLIPSELLLMDEPFSSLDTALKIRLTEVFARLWKSLPEKRTAVFVTHDLEEALIQTAGNVYGFIRRPERHAHRQPYPLGSNCTFAVNALAVLGYLRRGNGVGNCFDIAVDIFGRGIVGDFRHFLKNFVSQTYDGSFQSSHSSFFSFCVRYTGRIDIL